MFLLVRLIELVEDDFIKAPGVLARFVIDW